MKTNFNYLHSNPTLAIMCARIARCLILGSLLSWHFFKICTSNKGFVAEVLEDEKFQCPLTDRKIHSVTSEIQCAQRCLLYDKCELINYSTERETKENCEVFTNVSNCAKKVEAKGWKAIIFQVGLSICRLYTPFFPDGPIYFLAFLAVSLTESF